MKKTLVLLLALLFLSNTDAQAEVTFKDVSKTSAANDIYYLVNKGIIKGYEDGSFRPNQNVTKTQGAVLIARALKIDTSLVENPEFKDLSVKASGYKEIAKLVEMGVIDKESSFYGGNPLTRMEMAKWLTRAFKLEGEYPSYIHDVTKEERIFVDPLAALGITNMDSTQSFFNPKEPLTRAQISSFLSRTLNPKVRIYIPTIKILVPEIEFQMSIDDVKKNMAKYEKVSESESGKDLYSISYLNYPGFDGREYIIGLLFRDGKLVTLDYSNYDMGLEHGTKEYNDETLNFAKKFEAYSNVKLSRESLEYNIYDYQFANLTYIISSPDTISIQYGTVTFTKLIQ
ncbi:S-layer homology domain-containing protein [Paenisporosarcina quisquiliarum]|uniref:S-layer homology domain-containing protein n=1 Tax=Paenisporosarcina quisquiliarum TaxID=365346 RepID=UPI0037354A5C